MAVCEPVTVMQRFGSRDFVTMSWQQHSVSAPMAGVLALLSGMGKSEKAEIPRGLALVGGDLFSRRTSRLIVGQMAQSTHLRLHRSAAGLQD